MACGTQILLSWVRCPGKESLAEEEEGLGGGDWEGKIRGDGESMEGERGQEMGRERDGEEKGWGGGERGEHSIDGSRGEG